MKRNLRINEGMLYAFAAGILVSAILGVLLFYLVSELGDIGALMWFLGFSVYEMYRTYFITRDIKED